MLDVQQHEGLSQVLMPFCQHAQNPDIYGVVASLYNALQCHKCSLHLRACPKPAIYSSFGSLSTACCRRRLDSATRGDVTSHRIHLQPGRALAVQLDPKAEVADHLGKVCQNECPKFELSPRISCITNPSGAVYAPRHTGPPPHGRISARYQRLTP